MKISFFVPTYWARPTNEGHREGDRIFDHPTPLDTEGTLGRTLQSFEKLHDQEWLLIIGIATTTDEIQDDAYRKVKKVVKENIPTLQNRIRIMGAQEATWLKEWLKAEGLSLDKELGLFLGYPGIRNLGLCAGIIAGSDILIMVDDDQVFEDRDFVARVRETAHTRIKGEEIKAWSGYCPEQNGIFRVRPYEQWMHYWDKIKAQNDAYKILIETKEPRWKITPLAFGGCFVVKREVAMQLPFDPFVGRGEDMDYLMNARMFGITFYLDNRLSMLHLPPPRSHPQWQRIRQDMIRYLYQREKIKRQKKMPGMTYLTVEMLMPYPGVFLGEDIEERIEKANTLLASLYREQKKTMEEREALRNIEIMKQTKYTHNPFETLVTLEKNWKSATQKMDLERELLETHCLKKV